MSSMGKLIAVTIAVLIAALFICHQWAEVEDNREADAKSAWQYETAGDRSPEPFTYDRDLAAERPVLLPVALAGGVFVVGLLVIIASNSSSDRR